MSSQHALSLSPPLTWTLRTSLSEAGGAGEHVTLAALLCRLSSIGQGEKKSKCPVGRGHMCSHTTHYFLFRWGQ